MCQFRRELAEAGETLQGSLLLQDALTPAELSFIDTLKEVRLDCCGQALAGEAARVVERGESRCLAEPSCAVLQDLEQFNDFFIEKEEECIIRTQDLKEQLGRAQGDSRSLARVRSAFVDLHGERWACNDLHNAQPSPQCEPAYGGKGDSCQKELKCMLPGEMVLLLHWSMLNYTAVVKILKKHGALSNAGLLVHWGMLMHAAIKQPGPNALPLAPACRQAVRRRAARALPGHCAEAGGRRAHHVCTCTVPDSNCIVSYFLDPFCFTLCWAARSPFTRRSASQSSCAMWSSTSARSLWRSSLLQACPWYLVELKWSAVQSWA